MTKDEVIEFVRHRESEYSEWLWKNVENIMYEKPLIPPPAWAASNRKPVTYGDVVRRA